MSVLLLVAWLAPLVGAVLLWAFGPQLKQRGAIVGIGAVAIAFVAVVLLALQGAAQTVRSNDGLATAGGATATYTTGGDALPTGLHLHLVTWTPGFDFGLLLDPLSLLWALVITGIGGLIHLYSVGYMDGDRAFARFFSYLNFFVFAMTTLVLADDFVLLLIGWGLVGLASYFLIGFWFERPTAVAAARKAFVINVVGDIGLMAAIFAIFAQTQSITYSAAFTHATSLDPTVLFWICAAIFVACAAKSAQVPLHTWLPDAMEGPTPVSALIHAATMVTAGVYLVARCAPLWNASPGAQEVVGVIGAITALLGAILGIAQWDIKRILAYSTMSQIGYMIMGVGVGAYSAGVLHFLTHAFFKAQLFLTAGLVIHALHDEQDVRKMGGLRTAQPFAFWSMAIGVVTIAGVPGFSAFISKDAILYGTLEHGHPVLYAVGAITAGITAYYMARLLFVAFFGASRTDVPDDALGIAPRAALSAHAEAPAPHPHAQHAPAWLMQAPVALLAVGSVLIGYLAVGGAASPWTRFLAPLFGTGESSRPAPALPELGSTALVLVLVAVGFVVAYLRYASPAALRDAVPRLKREAVGMPRILTRAFFFDDAIHATVVVPARTIGEAFARFFDPVVIDGIVKALVRLVGGLGFEFRTLQSGLVRGYAMTVAAGVAAFAAYFVYFAFAGAGR